MICQIHGKVKVSGSRTRQKRSPLMISSPAAWPKPNVTHNTISSAEKIVEINTLGISSSCINYASGGLNPPHSAELIFVLHGTIDVGFITMIDVPRNYP